MGRLQRGNDALGTAEQMERLKGLGVVDLPVLGPARVFQVAMLGANPWIVQSRGDAVGLLNLAVPVLKQV